MAEPWRRPFNAKSYPLSIESVLEALANCADGVFAIDSNQRVMLWNTSAEAILGWSAGEVIGKRCYEIFEGRDERGHILCERACRDIRLAQDHAIVPGHDMVTKTKSGEHIWLNVSNISLCTPSYDLVAMAYLFRDVSPVKRLERFRQTLRSAFEELGVEGPSAGLKQMTKEELTPREQEVLALLVGGDSAPKIATALNVSVQTVRKHIQNILAKLGARSTIEAVISVLRQERK